MPDEKSVEIICPIPECKSKKSINIPKYLMEKKAVGTLKIQIHRGVCCPHEFIAFIDRKGTVRGYENIDMSIDLAEYAGRAIGSKIYLRDLLNQYHEYAVATMIHSFILQTPIVLLKRTNEKSRTTEINILGSEYLPEKYRTKNLVSTIDEEEYKKAEIDDKVVISPDGVVVTTPWTDITMNYELELIKKALDILDDDSQSIIIQDELDYLYQKAEFINNYIKTIDSIYEDDVKEKIKAQFKEQNPSDYDIMLLKHIIKYRLKGPVDKIKIRSFSKLKEGLW